MQISGAIQRLWASAFPFLAEPPGYSFGAAFAAPAAKAHLVGAWGILALVVVEALLNTVLGEELLFRGLLLPRMSGVFGKRDWVMNGLLFGIYHLHQPWGLLSSAVHGILLFALPTGSFAAPGSG
jgi:membrane protease YdiL (CAAX protease family)